MLSGGHGDAINICKVTTGERVESVLPALMLRLRLGGGAEPADGLILLWA